MRNYLILLFCYVLMLLVAGPFHEFPLNDDWTYSATARHLAETGEYIAGPVPAMTLWAHAAWGAMFVKLFGFSFSILSLSVMVMALMGNFFTYRLILDYTKNEFIAAASGFITNGQPGIFFALTYVYDGCSLLRSISSLLVLFFAF